MNDEEYQAAKKKLLEELGEAKRDILNEVRLSKSQIEEVVTDYLPKDHDKEHIELRRFLEHSPDPKIHGDHHDFTENVRTNLQHMIVAVFKGLGGIILIAFLIGFYSWVSHQAGIIGQ